MPSQELNSTILKNSANLKAYYRFEDNANDSKGSNNGTATDVTYVSGKFTKAGSFNGSSSKVLIANDASLNITDNVSLGAWVYVSATAALNTRYSIIRKGYEASSQTRYSLNLYSTGAAWHISFRLVSSAGREHRTEGVVELDKWNFIVATCNINGGSTPALYLNGAYQTLTSLDAGLASYTYPSETNALGVGSDSNSSNLMSGQIDDAFVYNGILTPDQIKELYEGRIYGELRPNQFGTTVGLWHLNGNSTDFSGNNNHLSNNGATTFSAGRFGNCADFSGTSQSLSIASNAGLIATNWSISCWAKAKSSNDFGFIAYVGVPTTNGYGLAQNNNVDNNSGNYINILYGVVVWLNTGIQFPNTTNFHHLALTRNTTTVTLYLNGNAVYTSTATPNAPGTQIAFGGGYTADTWAGYLDEVYIASTALTANQIRQIYAYQKGLLGRYA